MKLGQKVKLVRVCIYSFVKASFDANLNILPMITQILPDVDNRARYRKDYSSR